MQEKINNEKDHWRNVLPRIVVVKNLAKNNLAFRGKKDKIYEDGKEYSLSLIEMIVEFDTVMQEHLKCFQACEIHNHYLDHNIRNEYISL